MCMMQARRSAMRWRRYKDRDKGKGKENDTGSPIKSGMTVKGRRHEMTRLQRQSPWISGFEFTERREQVRVFQLVVEIGQDVPRGESFPRVAGDGCRGTAI